jgi:gas vesicle protein
MTYLISLAIQAAVIVAVIAIVLLLVRPGRSEQQNDSMAALDRLRDDAASTAETLRSTMSDRIIRSATETRQILLDRLAQLGREISDQVGQRLAASTASSAAELERIADRYRADLRDVSARLRENSEALDSLEAKIADRLLNPSTPQLLNSLAIQAALEEQQALIFGLREQLKAIASALAKATSVAEPERHDIAHRMDKDVAIPMPAPPATTPRSHRDAGHDPPLGT